MQKIPTLFQRNYEGNRLVRDEITPGAEWVIVGEGVATRKFDGTCVMFDGSRWWARREVKAGKARPAGFVEAETDETTGNVVGWEPAVQSGFSKWLGEGLEFLGFERPGTYELCGPKVQGNPERFTAHHLIPHGMSRLLDAPRDFEGLRAYFQTHDIEGIVWHHPDGRMAKLKARDFGLKRAERKKAAASP